MHVSGFTCLSLARAGKQQPEQAQPFHATATRWVRGRESAVACTSLTGRAISQNRYVSLVPIIPELFLKSSIQSGRRAYGFIKNILRCVAPPQHPMFLNQKVQSHLFPIASFRAPPFHRNHTICVLLLP